MPGPDGSPACDSALETAFPMADRGSRMELVGFDEKLEKRMDLDREIEELKRQQRQIDQEIKLAMGEHETAVSSRFRVSWSSVETSRIDSKKLKEEMPEVYHSFSTLSRTRRFPIKAA